MTYVYDLEEETEVRINQEEDGDILSKPLQMVFAFYITIISL